MKGNRFSSLLSNLEEEVDYDDIRDKRFFNIIYLKLWAKILLISVTLAVVLYKFIQLPIDLINFDFSDFLSLILAIFSIGMSMLFFINANETSNKFYDNTYKFTQDTSEILGRIESGFGERLRHLDEGYSKIADYRISTQSVELTEEKIEQSKEVVKTKEAEKALMINNLIARAQIQDTEKEKIRIELKQKDDELEKVKMELSMLQNNPNSIDKSENIKGSILSWFESSVIPEMDPKINSKRHFIMNFKSIIHHTDPDWLRDLVKLGMMDERLQLTPEGEKLLYNRFLFWKKLSH